LTRGVSRAISRAHGVSENSLKRSQEFLSISSQFKLGALTTEASHPLTADLSQTARRDISAALGQLFDVDGDVVNKYSEFAESGRARIIADTLLQALKNGGKLFFTGCGSTGRLSIQLVSIWRDFWQRP
jgi:N-acetylmuramic acid 6-phosphate etherase